MGPLDFRRHVLWLGAAAVAWLLLIRLPAPVAVDRAFFLLGASGALHATAVVLAVRARPSWIARLAFVPLAALVSIGALLVVLAAPGWLGLHGWGAIFAAFVALSAVGAAAYWLLVRIFWIPGLPAWSVLPTVGACLLSTVVATLVDTVGMPFPRDTLVPVLWWFAFSASLAWPAPRGGLFEHTKPPSPRDLAV